MIRVIATIKLYSGEKMRKTPFVSGYRPLFNFINEMKISGQINLIDGHEFFPDMEGIVKISFSDNKYLGKDFGVGSKFTFGEGRENLGEGSILEIL